MKEPTRFAAIELTELPSDAMSSRMSALKLLWLDRKSASKLPAREDFSPVDLRDWLGNISLVDVQVQPRRFRWRLIGTTIVEVLERDSSGRWFDEIYGDMELADFVQAYSLCVDRHLPVTFRGSVVFAGKDHIEFQMLQLPLAGNGTDVDMILLMLEFV